MINKLKNIFVCLIVAFVMFSTLSISVVHATETAVTTSEDTSSNEATTGDAVPISSEGTYPVETGDSTSSDSSQVNSNDIYEGDLYLSGNDVTMDKLVNGNVYIAGNNVTIKGQIAGNLMVAANTVTLEETYIQYSAFIVAKDVNFNAVASDLYTACQNLTIDNKAGVYRDLNATASSIKLTGIVGRNANINCSSLSLTDGTSTAQIYGNLKHYSSQKIEIPENSVQGTYDFKETTKKEESSSKVSDYVFSLLSFILTVLIIWAVLKLSAPKFYDASLELASKKSGKFSLIGLGWLVLLPIVSVLLLCTGFGIYISLLLFAIYLLSFFISIPVAAISIGNIINNKWNKKTTSMEFVCILISSLLFWIINQIPYISAIVLLASMLVIPGFIFSKTFLRNIKRQKTEKAEKSN